MRDIHQERERERPIFYDVWGPSAEGGYGFEFSLVAREVAAWSVRLDFPPTTRLCHMTQLLGGGGWTGDETECGPEFLHFFIFFSGWLIDWQGYSS